MKAAIEENHEIMNCMFDKIKEHDEAIIKMSLKDKIKTNRTRIYAMIGNVMAMIFEEFGDYVVLVMPGTPLGEFIKRLASIILFGAYAITVYVFGNKHELEIKSNIIMEKNNEIHALRTNGHMKDYLLEEAKITLPKGFEDPNIKK